MYYLRPEHSVLTRKWTDTCTTRWLYTRPGVFMHWDAEIKLYDARHVPQNDPGIGARGRQGFQMNQDWRRVNSSYCTSCFSHCCGSAPDGTHLQEGKFILAHSLRWGGAATRGKAAPDHLASAVGETERWIFAPRLSPLLNLFNPGPSQ